MNENKELLTEDEFKIMIAGFLTVFLFSEDWDNKGIKKLTPELKDKITTAMSRTLGTVYNSFIKFTRSDTITGAGPNLTFSFSNLCKLYRGVILSSHSCVLFVY